MFLDVNRPAKLANYVEHLCIYMYYSLFVAYQLVNKQAKKLVSLFCMSPVRHVKSARELETGSTTYMYLQDNNF